MADETTKKAEHPQHVSTLEPRRTVHCTFRTPERRKQFAEMISDYRLRNSALFHFPAGENRSNNIGEAFWRGYHGERFVWDREAPLYVAYRAGAAIRQVSPNPNAKRPGPKDVCQPEPLPPYIYGREAGPDEHVWTEAAVRQLAAERDSLRRRLNAAIAQGTPPKDAA